MQMQLTIHKRWWVAPYLHGCAVFSRLTNREPDREKMKNFILDHGGLYYVNPDYREPYLANLFLTCSLLLCACNILTAIHHCNSAGDSGINTFAGMFMALHYLALYQFSRSNK